MRGENDMQHKNGKLQVLAGIFEIPQDIILDLPRITLLGNKQLLIENHKGIIEYDPSLVRIKMTQGELIIRGMNFTLGNLQVEQILIEGTIIELKYDV
jgi:sporulation protein YqfC